MSRCRVAITAAIFSGVSRSFHDKTTLIAFRRRRFFRDRTATGFRQGFHGLGADDAVCREAVVSLELFDSSFCRGTKITISTTGQIARILKHILNALYDRATHTHLNASTSQGCKREHADCCH